MTPEADYAGFDYNTVKGTDLAGCEAACVADQGCQAFTFNQKAGGCFLKSDFGLLTATPGATAGRVVVTAELTPSLEQQRIGELDFLEQFLVVLGKTERKVLLIVLSAEFGNVGWTL